MNKEPTHRTSPALYVAGGMAGSLVVLLMLSSLFRAADPNVALARTAERAIQMAEESRREAEMARRTSSTIRLLALAAGVCAPLVVAYLIYRVSERPEPRPEDILEVAQTEGLAESCPLRLKHLTTAQPPLLAQQRNHRRPRQGN